MQQAPSHTISGRENFGSTVNLEKTPGPGNYNTDIVNPRERAAPSYSLGKKWSQTDGDKKVPGPGAYDASSTIGHTVLSTQKSNTGASFSKVERKPLHTSGTADVGPGQYSVADESTGASYSFGTEVRSKNDRSTDGAHYYDPKSSVGAQVESTYRTAPKVSMGGRTKFGSMDTMGSPTGHGGYVDPKSAIGGQVDSRKGTAPSASFGSGARSRPTGGGKSPGPGSYKISSTIGQAPAHTISGREKFGSTADLENSAKTPGPGNYNTDVINPRERAAPSYSLGKKWSQTDGDKKVPGPGAYDSNTTGGVSTQRTNAGSSFSKDERKPLHTSGTGDVGPGQYSVTASAVNSGASYSFGTGSRTQNDRSVADGPKSHYYDPKSSVGEQVESLYPTAPKATMAGRTKFGSHL
ncbi:hypothetical protein PHYBOEH_002463 [Phytophthora boehmeriae]|uniref:Uncharacterized protein n=1 Tax=Phytophthora boehmeriae TaxID=109152 RepID=A0A8T1WVS2_9STRA|nr:hypothetical protein PHYBOEH_002463 [Phytophthora boehmeriae]